jgi:hypothetical protein
MPTRAALHTRLMLSFGQAHRGLQYLLHYHEDELTHQARRDMPDELIALPHHVEFKADFDMGSIPAQFQVARYVICYIDDYGSTETHQIESFNLEAVLPQYPKAQAYALSDL